jgi:hypothetical protein
MKRQSYNHKRKPPRKNAQQRKKRRKDENSGVDAESKDTIQQQRDRKGKKVELEQSENKTEGGQSLATSQEIQKALEESNAAGPTTKKENPRRSNRDDLEKAKKGLVERKEKQPQSASKSKTKVSTDKKSSKKKTNKRSNNGRRRDNRRGEETPVSKGSESKKSNSDGSESMNQSPTRKEQQQK